MSRVANCYQKSTSGKSQEGPPNMRFQKSSREQCSTSPLKPDQKFQVPNRNVFYPLGCFEGLVLHKPQLTQVITSTSAFLPDSNSRKITTCHPKKLGNLKMDFSLQKVFASFFLAGASWFFVFFFGTDVFVCIPWPWKSSNLQATQNFSSPPPPSTLQSRCLQS